MNMKKHHINDVFIDKIILWKRILFSSRLIFVSGMKKSEHIK